MKFLPKSLVLALLLSPLAARADQWCNGENEHIWTYAWGQTPYVFQCDDVDTPTVTQASEYAAQKCQTSWDNFASNYAFSGPVSIIYTAPATGMPGFSRWKYRCRACVHGHLPLVMARPARLGPAEAGNVATGHVSGDVVSINLHGRDGDHPYYLVDIVTKSGQEQVEVDANTGEAQVIKLDDAGGVCRE